jgi:L-histidine N-alpha-methyltransferase
MADDGSLDRIEQLVAPGSGTRWTLLLTGEKPWNVLQELLHDLREPRGKKIATKFSYIGMAPTIAWANACSDLFYPVMRDSIDGFDRYFHPVLPLLEGKPHHYVSLGVGTGQKDRVILSDMRPTSPSMLYIPVDISADMIRLGIDETRKLAGLRVLPVQLDFSAVSHLNDLKTMVHRMVDDAPVLYSLLGNTVANTDDDDELLQSIGELLRPQDRLLLEVSTTSDVGEDALREAQLEYSSSEAYRVHATSALAQFTDMTIDSEWLDFRSAVEGDRAIRIEAHYRNAMGQPTVVSLPNGARITLDTGETVRVTLSRKYLLSGVDDLVNTSGLTRLNERLPQRPARGKRPVFSRDLLLLAKTPTPPRKSTVADDLLRAGKPTTRR